MLARKLTLAVLFGLTTLVGCSSTGFARRDAAYGPMDGELAHVAPEKSFVDRHPVLASPRNYYRDSSDNPVAKVLAGTFVGVPVGVAQEIWQIGYGQ